MGFRQGQCLRMSKAARLAKAPPKEWPTANTNTIYKDNNNNNNRNYNDNTATTN